MFASVRELCGSIMIGRKNPKSKWWDDVVKAKAKQRVILGMGNVVKFIKRKKEVLKVKILK